MVFWSSVRVVLGPPSFWHVRPRGHPAVLLPHNFGLAVRFTCRNTCTNCELVTSVFACFSMAIPYSNRVAIASFPELALQSKPRVTPTEVWADFSNQAAPLLNFFECIQLISASKLRILFPTAALMEDCLSEGLTFRSHPLTLTPISSKKWVSVQCLPYGIPLEEVKRVLNPFGKIFHAKHEYMEGVTTGTISVQMEVKANIPSKVQIKGHSCLIFYNGQQRTCFVCQAPDHITKNCPRRKGQQTAPDNNPAFHL